MNGLHPAYGYPEKFSNLADDFFSSYVLEKEISCLMAKMGGLLMKQNRICRFCNKKYPIVGFRKDAHVFSELICCGNGGW
jgi:hypothetical protein